MTPKLLKNEADYSLALKRIEEIFSTQPGSPEGEELELLVHLVEEYEAAVYPIGMPDPINAILFRMEQEGLKAADLVPYIGNKSKVSEVLHRKRPLSLSMIRKLHKGLGIPADILLQESGQALSPVHEGIDWQNFPLAEMLKRKWFPDFDGRVKDLCEKAEEVLGPLLFPNGFDCREIPMAARQNARKGSQVDDYALWAWQSRVYSLADRKKLGTYNSAAMTHQFMRSVINLSSLNDGPLQAVRLLESNGIAAVVLHYLPGTHLDGAALLRNDGRPIIALTLRHDRLDNFWFTLAHEMAHVVLHLAKGNKAAFIDDLEKKDVPNQQEKEANQLAAELLIPAQEWGEAAILQSPTESRVRILAVKTNVHQAVVAGRIRFELNNYKILNHLVGRRCVRKLFPNHKSGDAE